MRRLLVVLISALLFTNVAWGAQWARTYGGAGDDVASSVLQTADGGYLVAGYTDSFGVSRGSAWVLKLSPRGDVEWQRTYGGGYAISAGQTLDGGYIVAGSIANPGSVYDDAMLLKLDAKGNTVWQKAYGSAFPNHPGFHSIHQTPDGGYVVAGDAVSGRSSEYWVLKLDGNGDIVWQRNYGGLPGNSATSVYPADAGYIVAGVTSNQLTGQYVTILLKLDGSGNVTWQRTIQDLGQSFPGSSVQPTPDGGLIFAGFSGGIGGSTCLGIGGRVLKLDSKGDIAWQKSFSYSDARSVQRTADGGYVVVGLTNLCGSNGDAWMIKLDTSGNVIWQRAYGGAQYNYFSSGRATADGGYVVAGATGSFGAGSGDAWVLKLDSEGNIGGCSLIGTASAIVGTVTQVTGIGTATALAGASTPRTITVAPMDTTAVPQQQCYYDGSGAHIPTLAWWGVILMSMVLAASGGLARRSN